MYLLQFLTVFAVIQFIYGGTGQGIENVPTPRRGSPGETPRFFTSTLKLSRDNSLELDDNRELYRQKRKRAVKTKKPYYIPPDYETIDEYE